MNVYLIRHAESVANANGFISGDIRGIELSKKGKTQAKALGEKLSGLPTPDRVFASPAQRTQETARIALAAAKLPKDFATDPRLTERSEGIFAGKTKRSLFSAPGFPTRLWRFIQDGKSFALPGGESINETGQRMRSWLEDTRQDSPAQTIFVFSHEMAIKSLFSELFSWSKVRVFCEPLPNVGIRKISYTDSGWQESKVFKNSG